MKFAKIAKDIAGRVLNEGDVIMYSADGVATSAVIDKIIQRSRDQFPSVQVMGITADWRGNNVKVRRSTINVETYKLSRVIDASLLRDDVPKNAKVKEVQQSVLAKTPKKIRR